MPTTYNDRYILISITLANHNAHVDDLPELIRNNDTIGINPCGPSYQMLEENSLQITGCSCIKYGLQQTPHSLRGLSK